MSDEMEGRADARDNIDTGEMRHHIERCVDLNWRASGINAVANGIVVRKSQLLDWLDEIERLRAAMSSKDRVVKCAFALEGACGDDIDPPLLALLDELDAYRTRTQFAAPLRGPSPESNNPKGGE